MIVLALNPDLGNPMSYRPLIIQTINNVRPKNLSLKYQRSTTSSCKGIGIRKLELVGKTHFL